MVFTDTAKFHLVFVVSFQLPYLLNRIAGWVRKSELTWGRTLSPSRPSRTAHQKSPWALLSQRLRFHFVQSPPSYEYIYTGPLNYICKKITGRSVPYVELGPEHFVMGRPRWPCASVHSVSGYASILGFPNLNNHRL